MTALQYNLTGDIETGEKNLTLWIPGRTPLVAHSSHPQFERIVSGVLAGDERVVDLFDISLAVASRFDKLSERVSVANGRLYFDSVEVDNTLTAQVVRFLNEGLNDWRPLVAFFENVEQNPQQHSREQLYNWLNADSFTITSDGLIVGYKGVAKQPDGTLVSVNSGTAIVDGEKKSGAIPNHIGAIVEMPRNEVTFDPAVGCSRGLHVGTHEYAKGWAQGALLEVHVNPRDVVSVPTDCSAQKMRVCRYKVVGIIEHAYTAPVLYDYEQDDDGWGDGEYESDDFYGREYSDEPDYPF